MRSGNRISTVDLSPLLTATGDNRNAERRTESDTRAATSRARRSRLNDSLRGLLINERRAECHRGQRSPGKIDSTLVPVAPRASQRFTLLRDR